VRLALLTTLLHVEVRRWLIWQSPESEGSILSILISFSVPETILLFKSIFKTGWIQIQDWTSIEVRHEQKNPSGSWVDERGIRNYNTLIAWSSIHLDHSSINWLDIASSGANAIWLPGDNLVLWQLPAMKWWYSEFIALTSSHPNGRSYAYIYVVRVDH
jgi:hypothetical protein